MHNKPNEARKVFCLIAKLNGKAMPEGQICVSHDRTEGTTEAGILDLFSPRAQLLTTLILWFTWLVMCVLVVK